ncbi:MAG: DUF6671 family protein [Cyanobium sp.]
MSTPSPYRGARVALATRHGKERVIARALHHGLGADLLHLSQIDTDALGSFCGTVPRRGTAQQACLAKAELALEQGGTGLAIASEGSFGPHPAVPLLPVGIECMVFLDRARGLTLQEELLARRTNYGQRRVRSDDLPGGAPTPDLERWLQAAGFPSHALIVRGVECPGVQLLLRGIRDRASLLEGLQRAIRGSADGCARLETDMRAHCNPTRMASIRQLSFQLVRRLATPCPRCRTPGWGVLATCSGLPCAWCGEPTALVRAELLGCVLCDHRMERPRRDGLLQADPGQCCHCNP